MEAIKGKQWHHSLHACRFQQRKKMLMTSAAAFLVLSALSMLPSCIARHHHNCSSTGCPPEKCCGVSGTCGRSLRFCGPGSCLSGPCLLPTASPPQARSLDLAGLAPMPLPNGDASAMSSTAPAPSPQGWKAGPIVDSSNNKALILSLSACILAALALAMFFCCCFCTPSRHPWDEHLKGSLFKRYRLKEVLSMTYDLHDDWILGRGECWVVYCGQTLEGAPCAVKVHHQITSYPYEKEVVGAYKMRHKNLVNLLGYCVDRGQHILVYEYDPYKSLQERLHGQEQMYATLKVHRRLGVAQGVAEALQHLHHHGFFFCDVIPTNVWVDRDGQAKLADFGFMREIEGLTLDAVTAAQGKDGSIALNAWGKTMLPEPMVDVSGYMDPEYGCRHRTGWKVDVFRLGVMLLEIITGRGPYVGQLDREVALLFRTGKFPPSPLSAKSFAKSSKSPPSHDQVSPQGGDFPNNMTVFDGSSERMTLREWVSILKGAGKFKELLDPRVFPTESLHLVVRPTSTEADLQRQVLESYFNLALRCTGPHEQRPQVRFVVSELAGIGRLWQASHVIFNSFSHSSPSSSLTSSHMSTMTSAGYKSLGRESPASPTEQRAGTPRHIIDGLLHSPLDRSPSGASEVREDMFPDAPSEGLSSIRTSTRTSSAAVPASGMFSLVRSTLPDNDSTSTIPRARPVNPRTMQGMIHVLLRPDLSQGSSDGGDTAFSLPLGSRSSMVSSRAPTAPRTLSTASAFSSVPTMTSPRSGVVYVAGQGRTLSSVASSTVTSIVELPP